LQLATAEGQAKLFVNFPFAKLYIDSTALRKMFLQQAAYEITLIFVR